MRNNSAFICGVNSGDLSFAKEDAILMFERLNKFQYDIFLVQEHIEDDIYESDFHKQFKKFILTESNNKIFYCTKIK